MDGFGFIGHKRPDGGLEFGDGSQRTFTFWIAQIALGIRPDDHVIGTFDKQLSALRSARSEWVRHPDATEWYGQPGTMSRDNSIPLLVAMGFFAAYSDLTKMFLGKFIDDILCRGGFFWNTKKIGQTDGWKIPDFAGPVFWGAMIRAEKTWYLWPLLWVTDLFMVVSSCIRVVKSFVDPDDVSDDLNHQVMLVQAKIVYSTIFSWLAN